MTSKEKAIELIEKLESYVDYTECDVFTKRQNMLKNAKNCATILVDEIIQEIETNFLERYDAIDRFNFWEAVKLEIEIYR